MDIRDVIFKDIKGKRLRAVITAMDNGVLCGIKIVEEKAKRLRLKVTLYKEDGNSIKKGDSIMIVEGSPKKIALAEEKLIGCLCKTSGISTAARKAKFLSGNRLKVVCGAWKKMPSLIKENVREAILIGGISYRITDTPFLYLDKNFVKIFGGVKGTLRSLGKFNNRIKVIQLKSSGKTLIKESLTAAREGSDIIMIDTGNKKDIEVIDKALSQNGLREGIKLAFGGNVKLKDLGKLKRMNLDIVDIGREIVDAPLLDMKLDVIQ